MRAASIGSRWLCVDFRVKIPAISIFIKDKTPRRAVWSRESRSTSIRDASNSIYRRASSESSSLVARRVQLQVCRVPDVAKIPRAPGN